MNHSSALKTVRKEVGISRHMPISHLNEATVFESTNSMVGSVIKVAGVPFDTEKNEQLNNYRRTLHRFILSLGEEFCIYETKHRRKVNVELEGDFSNEFAKELNKNYYTKFDASQMYVNDIYLTIIYKGITSGKAGKGLTLLDKISSKTIKDSRAEKRKAQIKLLKRAVSQALTSLSTFRPHLVGSKDQELGYSELLSFFGIMINGGEHIKFNFMSAAPAIAKSIVDNKNALKLYPYGNASQYIATKRIFFGRNIQFQGATDQDAKFAAILSVKQYGNESACIMLDNLLHLDCEFIETNSFAIEAQDVALGLSQKEIARKENVKDAAVSQIEMIHLARDMLASGRITMGYHHNTLMLICDSQVELEQKITKAIKCYADAGISAVKETIGQEPAFWAQIPTNMKHIARSALITSENFVDFCPLHNYRTGYYDANHLGSAVTLLETPSKTPFFFNFHAKGSKDNPSKGHTTVIGGNGAGKTVLMCFLDAQTSRYGGHSYIFDRDRGAEIYVRAAGGSYSILSPDYPGETRFNPLKLSDTPGNRKFCREWLAQLVKHEKEDVLPPEIMEEVTKCIDYAYDQLAPDHRKLSNAVKVLPIKFPRWSSLRRWVKDSKHGEGEYAYIFDNEEDSLSLQDKMGFDMTHFLDNEPDHVRTAVMMYLFHRIKLSLDGKLVSIYLDEGWQYLRDSYWKTELEKILPTFRKKNAHIVLLTQSPSSVVESPLRNVIMDNVATSIYFANPQAKTKDYVDGFGLSESEFESIKENEPESRLFLVKQEHDSTLCKLDLSHMGDVLTVLSGNAKTVKLLDEIRAEVGNESQDWLSAFYERRKQ